MKKIIILILLLSIPVLAGSRLVKINNVDTLKYNNLELRQYYNNNYKIITSVQGLTEVRVPTYQLTTPGKYAYIEVPSNKRLKAASLRGLYIKWNIESGAIVIVHTDMRYRYYNFTANTAQTVVATTQVFGTTAQWNAVRNIIRKLVYEQTGTLYN